MFKCPWIEGPIELAIVSRSLFLLAIVCICFMSSMESWINISSLCITSMFVAMNIYLKTPLCLVLGVTMLLKTPMTFTRSPGLTLSTRSCMITTSILLGSKPVGAFSGISYSIRVYISLNVQYPNSVDKGWPCWSFVGNPFASVILFSSDKLYSSK